MSADPVTRFSVSMPGSLVCQLDELVRTRGHANRSQAVAEMVRARLVADHAQQGDHQIAGTITLVYDHHKRDLQAHLTDIQHECEGLIVAALHVHLDHHHCMEVLAVRGRAEAVRQAADRLLTAKGVRHGALTVTTTGKDLKP
jgi:CopG family nickel-responsive transcriptional regulator